MVEQTNVLITSLSVIYNHILLGGYLEKRLYLEEQVPTQWLSNKTQQNFEEQVSGDKSAPVAPQ